MKTSWSKSINTLLRDNFIMVYFLLILPWIWKAMKLMLGRERLDDVLDEKSTRNVPKLTTSCSRVSQIKKNTSLWTSVFILGTKTSTIQVACWNLAITLLIIQTPPVSSISWCVWNLSLAFTSIFSQDSLTTPTVSSTVSQPRGVRPPVPLEMWRSSYLSSSSFQSSCWMSITSS